MGQVKGQVQVTKFKKYLIASMELLKKATIYRFGLRDPRIFNSITFLPVIAQKLFPMSK